MVEIDSLIVKINFLLQFIKFLLINLDIHFIF